MSRSDWFASISVVVCFWILIPLVISTKRLDCMFEDGLSTALYIYIAGCISGLILVPLSTNLLRGIAGYLLPSKDRSDHDLYRLDHGILNVEVTPTSMWMNMGFWEQTRSFPTACRALLDEVLMAAGLLGPDRMPLDEPNTAELKIIDLGFGCGDQTIYLAQLARKTQRTGDDTDLPVNYLLDSYVGLTILPSQYRFATERLESLLHKNGRKVKLFCADAAKPDTWTEDIHKAVTYISVEKDGADVASTTSNQNTWVLALDTLYHFKPSREPIFRHAFGELNASIMAFDLLLSDTPSIWNLILLHIVCFFAATPFYNFLTISDYKKQLLAAGYQEDKIEIRDISDHVFAGIASFIERRDKETRENGMTIGRYRVAGKVFRWWARSGIVRGCIVVARR